MRQIKFRIWIKEQKEIMLVDQIDLTGDHGYCVYDEDGNEFWFNDEQAVLMQFTGEKDKNGKEIYEGDIIRWKDCDYIGGVSKIVWNIGGCNFEMKPNHGGYDYEPTLGSCFEGGEMEVELIGNAYENPDLITHLESKGGK